MNLTRLVSLDPEILISNVIQLRKCELFNLQDFISLLKSNITMCKLTNIRSEINEEYDMRCSFICEMIPGTISCYSHLANNQFYSLLDDIWINIFRIVSTGVDISHSLHLTQVCKRWKNIYSERTDEATIEKRESLLKLYEFFFFVHSVEGIFFFYDEGLYVWLLIM